MAPRKTEAEITAGVVEEALRRFRESDDDVYGPLQDSHGCRHPHFTTDRRYKCMLVCSDCGMRAMETQLRDYGLV